MNWFTRIGFHTFKTINTTQLKAHWKRSALSYINIKQFVLLENKCLHTSVALSAGHSKWSNIKHIKGIKDAQKSTVFSKLIMQLRMACKEEGGTNPKLNSKVAKIMEQARQINMPSSTIENAFKSIEKAADNAKPGSITIIGMGGLIVVIDVLTDNINRTRTDVRTIARKINFKDEKNPRLESVFDEKGFVVTKAGDLDKAMDDAIVAGAEDVTEEDGLFTFVCHPNDFPKVKNSIEKLNYEVEYASVDKIPYSLLPVELGEKELNKLKEAWTKLEEHVEVVKLHSNFEL